MPHADPANITAGDVMTPGPVCIPLGATTRDVARVFEEHRVSGAPVVDSAGRLAGVVSRTDLVRRYSDGDLSRDPATLIELFGGQGSHNLPAQLITIDDFMTTNPITAHPDAPIGDVARRMVQARVHRVIIVDAQQRPVGIITSLDLVKALAASFPSR